MCNTASRKYEFHDCCMLPKRIYCSWCLAFDIFFFSYLHTVWRWVLCELVACSDVASSFYAENTEFFDIHFLAIKRAEFRLFTVFLCIKMEIFLSLFFFQADVNRKSLQTFPTPCTCSMAVQKPNRCRQFAQF